MGGIWEAGPLNLVAVGPPVMKQSEDESANDALVIHAKGRQFGPLNFNQMKHRMSYRKRYRIRYDAENIRCVHDFAYDESICHDTMSVNPTILYFSTSYVMTYVRFRRSCMAYDDLRCRSNIIVGQA
jgi:hypothetical protein